MQGNNDRFVESRQFGEAAVTVISEGSIRVPIEWVLNLSKIESKEDVPGDADGKERFDHLSHHVRLGGASVLVDVGLDDPSSTQSQANPYAMGLVRSPGLQAGLESIGVRPEDITHVVITHAHWDHYMGVAAEQDGRFVPRYPKARHFMHRLDWEAHPEFAGPDSDLTLRLDAIREAGLLELVDGDQEIVPGPCSPSVSSQGGYYSP